MPRSRTRARERTIDHRDNPKWPKARRAQLYREVIRRMKKVWAYQARQREGQPNPFIVKHAKEKAPDREGEGSSYSVVPSQDPEQPQARLRTL